MEAINDNDTKFGISRAVTTREIKLNCAIQPTINVRLPFSGRIGTCRLESSEDMASKKKSKGRYKYHSATFHQETQDDGV